MLFFDHIQYGYGFRKIGSLSGTLRLASFGDQSRITLVYGRNGSGKSTFLKTVAGLLPLLGGRILWQGAPLDEVQPSGKICYLGDRLDFPEELKVGTILDTLEGYSSENKRLADLFMLDRRMPWQRLSTGQRQKVCLCLALRRMETAELTLLDEPFSGLDLDSQELAMNLLQERTLRQEKRLLICLHQAQFPPGWIQNRLIFENQSFILRENLLAPDLSPVG